MPKPLHDGSICNTVVHAFANDRSIQHHLWEEKEGTNPGGGPVCSGQLAIASIVGKSKSVLIVALILVLEFILLNQTYHFG